VARRYVSSCGAPHRPFYGDLKPPPNRPFAFLRRLHPAAACAARVCEAPGVAKPWSHCSQRNYTKRPLFGDEIGSFCSAILNVGVDCGLWVRGGTPHNTRLRYNTRPGHNSGGSRTATRGVDDDGRGAAAGGRPGQRGIPRQRRAVVPSQGRVCY
jgi:hypothetical protein